MASPYTPEFKQQAVRLVEESGLSIREAADDLGVSTESVRNWVREGSHRRRARIGPEQRGEGRAGPAASGEPRSEAGA
jgi:transposase